MGQGRAGIYNIVSIIFAVLAVLAEPIVLEVVDFVQNLEVAVLAAEKAVLVDLLLELVR